MLRKMVRLLEMGVRTNADAPTATQTPFVQFTEDPDSLGSLAERRNQVARPDGAKSPVPGTSLTPPKEL